MASNFMLLSASLFVTAAILTPGRVSAEVLEFIAGGFVFEKYEYAFEDYGETDFRFPYVNQDALLFSGIKGSSIRLYGMPLNIATNSNTKTFQVPSVPDFDPDKQKKRGMLAASEAINVITVQGYFPGPAILGRDSKNPGKFRIKSVTAGSEELSVQSDANIPSSAVDYDASDPDDQIWADAVGIYSLSKKNSSARRKPIFLCRKKRHCDTIQGFDRSGNVIAVGYSDEQGFPRVCIFHDHKECRDLVVRHPEGRFTQPKFSRDGRYLAIAVHLPEYAIPSDGSKAGLRWELHIYSRKEADKQSYKFVTAIDSVSLYDISTKVFFYDSSYVWVGSTLYFQSSNTESKSVQKIDCREDGTCERPNKIVFPKCVRVKDPMSGRPVRKKNSKNWYLEWHGAAHHGDGLCQGRIEDIAIRAVSWVFRFPLTTTHILLLKC
ncbi:MAG: hypothetical protein GKS00_24625 [Alphaproteobacteria bacterium]|nr:hypothetical protein [Alphaproteobacteria bacterium]